MRFFIFLLLLHINCAFVYADSIHAQKIILVNGVMSAAGDENESNMKEIREFIESQCPIKKRARISAQAVSGNLTNSKASSLIRLRIIEETGLPESQVFTMPGGSISADYLRRNNLLDSLPKKRNPVVVEVFC